MVMPVNLLLVRHGESEGNVANRESRKGINRRFANQKFTGRHSSLWRLTEKGVSEAQLVGDTIRSLGFVIGRKYTSPFIRAMETLGCMALDGPPAFAAYGLRERSWGKLDRMTHEERLEHFSADFLVRDEDPFLWEPTGGESLVEATDRVRDWLSTLYRECGEMECVVATCHAETIEVVRVVTERMLPQHYMAMKKDPSQGIWNCSILHYTRQDPSNSTVDPCEYYKWVRLITPPEAHLHGEVGFDWREIVRPTFSNAELLEHVELVAPQIQY